MEGTAAWILFLMFFPLFCFCCRMAAIAWKSCFSSKKIKNLEADDTESRQSPLTTVSRSIESTNTNGGTPNHTRRDSNASLKNDLPPTYEEVMNNLVETTITPPPTSRDTHAAIEMETAHTSHQQRT